MVSVFLIRIDIAFRILIRRIVSYARLLASIRFHLFSLSYTRSNLFYAVKYQQGYFSRSLQTAFLETITSALDSAQFHKSMGGAQGFLHDGCRAFWREAQHLPNVSLEQNK